MNLCLGKFMMFMKCVKLGNIYFEWKLVIIDYLLLIDKMFSFNLVEFFVLNVFFESIKIF